MNIHLTKATIADSKEIHKMQIAAFQPLLDKYQDYDISPATETLERVQGRFAYDFIDQYFISLHNQNIGYIRIRRLDEGIFKIVQIFILPEFQNNGYAQVALTQAESQYPQAKKWVLDTIKQEQKLCHLYEKKGYRLTGIEKNIKNGMDLVDYEKDC